eukprot:scaffold78839_cov20-Tisochrysis_lutea.AAC.1
MNWNQNFVGTKRECMHATGQDFPPDKEREVRISGASDCVDLAERMVTRIIDNGDNKGIQQVIQR